MSESGPLRATGSESRSLRATGALWIVLALITGGCATGLWFKSTQAWGDHLSRAYIAGFSIYEALRTGQNTAADMSIRALSIDEAALAAAGDFDRLPDTPHPAYVTNASILTSASNPTERTVLTIALVSDQLIYPVSDIVPTEYASPAEKLGAVLRLVATYCSETTVYARFEDQPWQRIKGSDVWGCKGAPRDLRLPAAFASFIVIAALLTHMANTTALFDTFSKALRTRRRFGGPDSYDTDGPRELRDIVMAVNSYLEAERAQLAQRAIVLSGVSHDLGTPATRLRLRTALITDDELRGKLETDIDQMTAMIESVLTYTQSEINVEETRKISLSALIDAVVGDYQDMGQPVSVREHVPVIIEGASSVFMSRRGQNTLSDEHRVLITARPVSLKRAVSNLIDNALKYARRAVVELEVNAQYATIIIEDEGGERSIQSLEHLVAPFERGENTKNISGFGLGLTIVSTVASQHGGTLSFETGAKGLRARLSIQRV